ncbi:amidohydrolase family protein [Microbacterium resistens]|uniref:amidohydrolase family protein n=1 Tax=Microbacterium resistens TaxID=156977 RepID=UPI001C583129|nr:amidohydrolase family protein [Microbacterium resistens]MBW1640011.1 amidohydrolase family protein [Microbacterium resistens]
MGATHDLVITGGSLVTESGVIEGDLGVDDGRIAAVGASGTLGAGRTATIDATDRLVVPGLVDLHVHLSTHNAGAVGHAMLARAGVTTALDLTGPTEETVSLAASHGAGLTIGVVEAIRPGPGLPERPTPAQVRRAIDRVVSSGALGVKLHVDSGWGPDATATIIAEASARRLWVAVHCGTTATASDLTGLAETLELADGEPIQVAHVNSYCRGDVDDPAVEAERAVELLRGAPRAVGESYLDRFNATWGSCVDGVPENTRLPGWLVRGGFTPDEDGVVAAILAGWAGVVHPGEEVAAILTGAEGVEVYRAAGTRIALCLPVNPAVSRVALATSKDATGAFDVPALATDGGGLPRNTTLAAGLALVELGFLTLPELVHKASTAPARLLGLHRKGRIAEGTDADLAVVDPTARRVSETIAGGRVVHWAGGTLRAASTLLTTAEADVAWPGERLEIDTAETGLRRGDWR